LIRSDETFVDLSRLFVDAVLLLLGVVAPLLAEDEAVDVAVASISRMQLIKSTNSARYLIDFIVLCHSMVRGMENFLSWLLFHFQSLAAFHSFFSLFSHKPHNDALHFGIWRYSSARFSFE
jgi:hypothetical protein